VHSVESHTDEMYGGNFSQELYFVTPAANTACSYSQRQHATIDCNVTMQWVSHAFVPLCTNSF